MEGNGAARDRSAGHQLGAAAARGGKRLPAELQAVDAYLDDEYFIAPWRVLVDRRLGRPSVPIDTLLRLLSLKHRYAGDWRDPERIRGWAAEVTMKLVSLDLPGQLHA